LIPPGTLCKIKQEKYRLLQMLKLTVRQLNMSLFDDLGSSPRGGAKVKPLKKCKGFFVFDLHTVCIQN